MKKTQTNKSHGAFWKYLREIAGYNEDFKEDIKCGVVRQYSGGKTESLKEMWENYPADYSRMIEALKGDYQRRKDRYYAERDKAAKRVIAAICGYLDKCGYTFEDRSAKVSYALGVACRSANCRSFDKIPLERLDSIYYMFRKKEQVDINSAELNQISLN